jgi:hypothetical protein
MGREKFGRFAPIDRGQGKPLLKASCPRRIAANSGCSSDACEFVNQAPIKRDGIGMSDGNQSATSKTTRHAYAASERLRLRSEDLDSLDPVFSKTIQVPPVKAQIILDARRSIAHQRIGLTPGLCLAQAIKSMGLQE